MANTLPEEIIKIIGEYAQPTISTPKYIFIKSILNSLSNDEKKEINTSIREYERIVTETVHDIVCTIPFRRELYRKHINTRITKTLPKEMIVNYNNKQLLYLETIGYNVYNQNTLIVIDLNYNYAINITLYIEYK